MKIYNELFGSDNTSQKKDETPAGMKPGGKWVDTKFGRVYQEP